MRYYTLIIPRSLLERIVKNTFRLGYRQGFQDGGIGWDGNHPEDLKRAVKNAWRALHRDERKHTA